MIKHNLFKQICGNRDRYKFLLICSIRFLYWAVFYQNLFANFYHYWTKSGKGVNFYIKTKAQEMDRQLFQIVLHRGASKSINFFVFVLLKAPVFHNMHQSPSLTRIYISKFWIIITQIIKVTHWTSPRGQIWHNHVHYIHIMYNYICTSI